MLHVVMFKGRVGWNYNILCFIIIYFIYKIFIHITISIKYVSTQAITYIKMHAKQRVIVMNQGKHEYNCRKKRSLHGHY